MHAVLGSGGIRTPELPEGAYLGQGATLRAGQTLEVPPGAMAELQLKSGATLRLNENTQLRMPASASDWRFRLDRGELVALVPVGQGPIGVEVSDDEWLEVHSGEARTLARPGERAHDVVYGASRLYRGADVIALGPGSHVDSARADVTAPRAKGTETIVAEVSLAPLEATEWSRQFETAGRMLDAVPAGVGSLTARRAGSSVQRQTLELVDHKVNVAISGRIAHTEIEQTFFNTAPAVLEGTYRFPLPTDASISGLDLLVGNRWMEAAMVEKSRAQRIFKSIVDATIPRDPALLHWEQGNIFKLKIFPIPGRGERSIRLSYTQVLDSVGDTLRYRYPMGGASGGVAGDAIGNFEFTVTVDRRDLPPGSEEALVSPMLALDRSQQGDRIQLHTRKHNFRPTHDLGVDIPLPTEERRLHAETHLDRDGQAYFMVAMTPTLEGLRARASDRPVDVVFVIDRSHSTTPELWAVARSLVGALSESLGDRDRVAALACDSACDESPGGLAPRSREQLAALDSFLEGQQLAGASDLGGMLREGARTLQAAPSAAPGGGPERERVVVYLGDGNPTAGELRADALLTQLAGDFGPGGAQLQLVALGARSDLLVLEALARELGGDLVQADARDDFGGLVRELRARAAIPSVRDLELDLPDGMVQVHPKRLAAIRPGETITLTGKLSQPVRGDVTLRARGPDGVRVEERFNVQLEAAVDGTSGRHAHLPRTWAREEIDFLTATQGDAGKRDIVALSTEYTVLSRYTALIALENDAMYREFNVVRKRGRKDTWDGRLENRDSAAPSTIAPTETASSASPSVPLGGAPLPDASPPPPAREAKSEEAEPEEAEASADEAAEKLDAKSFDEGGASRDPAPPPSAKDDAPSFSPPRLEDADNDASGDDEADALDRFEVELGEDFEGEPQAPATTKAPAPKSTKKMKKKASSGSAKPSAPSRDGSLSNPFDSGWGPGGSSGGGSSSGWAGGKKKWRPRRPQLVASRASAPSSRTRDRVDDLRRRRDAAPTNRSAHLQLVRAAARAGAPETLQFAQAWSKADPDYAPAMIALADQLAAHGDTLAPRVYGSAVELRPFDRTLQDRVASGYESKGDLERACAHRRALTSIAPTRGDYHAELARCLARVGQLDDAREAARRGLEKATRDQSKLRSLERQLSQVVVDRSALEGGDRLHSGPQLKAKLTWNGAADLDIALVDSRGRRLSAMYPKSVRVREEDGEETLTIAKVSSKVFVEVSRHDQGAAPVTARLTVTAGGRSRSFDITVGRDSQRVAAVDWKLR
ncbi:MAG: hypothetical protein KC468_36315 [Myxococcales bacterium]|nr:hypothetical protein [Myxococcales bacterium]